MPDTDLALGPQPEHLTGQPVQPVEPSTPRPPVPAGGARRHRGRLVVAGVAAVAVLAGSVLVPTLLAQLRPAPVDRSLDRVRVYQGLRRDHTPDAVRYTVTPPVGGPHDPEWLECGAYDHPVRDENAVHDLEHGTVWITYDGSLPASDVAALARRLPENGLLSPHAGLPSPVVVTVWGRQLRLTGPDDPRLPLFLAAFGDGHTAPEPFASCAGGVTGGTSGEGSPGDTQQV